MAFDKLALILLLIFICTLIINCSVVKVKVHVNRKSQGIEMSADLCFP